MARMPTTSDSTTACSKTFSTLARRSDSAACRPLCRLDPRTERAMALRFLPATGVRKDLTLTCTTLGMQFASPWDCIVAKMGKRWELAFRQRRARQHWAQWSARSRSACASVSAAMLVVRSTSRSKRTYRSGSVAEYSVPGPRHGEASCSTRSLRQPRVDEAIQPPQPARASHRHGLQRPGSGRQSRRTHRGCVWPTLRRPLLGKSPTPLRPLAGLRPGEIAR